MQDANALQAAARASRRNPLTRLRRILLRPVWLPQFVYEILPYLYIGCGLLALLSAIYTPDWTWILPWAILVGLLCLHAGLALLSLRARLRPTNQNPGEQAHTAGRAEPD